MWSRLNLSLTIQEHLNGVAGYRRVLVSADAGLTKGGRSGFRGRTRGRGYAARVQSYQVLAGLFARPDSLDKSGDIRHGHVMG